MKNNREKPIIESIKKFILSKISEFGNKSKVFYIDEKIYKKNTELEIKQNKYTIDSDSILVFIDDEPGVNWSHSCRYVLVDIDTHEIKMITEKFPPYLTKIPKTFKLLWKSQEIQDWTLLVRK